MVFFDINFKNNWYVYDNVIFVYFLSLLYFYLRFFGLALILLSIFDMHDLKVRGLWYLLEGDNLQLYELRNYTVSLREWVSCIEDSFK